MVNNVRLLLLLVHGSSSIVGTHHLLHAVVVVPLHAQVATVTTSSAVATHITVTVPVRATLGRRAGIAGRGVRNLWSQSVGREDVAQLVVLSWGRGRCPRLHKARVVGRLLVEWLKEKRWRVSCTALSRDSLFTLTYTLYETVPGIEGPLVYM